jgi:deazaflavin-dependent oxidoreductase (nitroreductase family)
VTESKDEVIASLGKGGVFDISTTGRKSGEARRLEIGFHVIDGRLYISGMPMPRRRAWLANLDSDAKFTLHLRKPAPRDVTATARIIDTEAERRSVMPHIARNWGRKDIDTMVRQSPLIEVEIGAPD